MHTLGAQVMRGLFLAGLLIVLSIVGYLYAKQIKQQVRPTAASADNTARTVEQRVNAISAQHMRKLKHDIQQMSQ